MMIYEQVKDKAAAALTTAGAFSLQVVKELAGINGLAKAVNAWNQLLPFSNPGQALDSCKGFTTFVHGLIIFDSIRDISSGRAFQTPVKGISQVSLAVSSVFLTAAWLEDWSILPQGSVTKSKIAVISSPAEWIGWGADIASLIDVRQIWRDGIVSWKNFDRFVTIGSAASKLVGVVQRSNITSFSPQLRTIGMVSSATFFFAKQIRKYVTTPAAA